MANLRDKFQQFYVLPEDAVETAMQEGLVAPDSNVLLAFYRLQASAREELFGALEKLGTRLWIPYQVGLEFHRNRLNVMNEQQKLFSNTKSELDELVKGMLETVRAFATRIALDEDQIAGVDENIRRLQELLTRMVLEAGRDNVHVGEHASDTVLPRIEALLGDQVGEPMEEGVLETALKEAKRRLDENIPPGYMDKKKFDPAGDYLIWRQLMDEAIRRKLPVVFITDDRKEDWYRREHGQTLGARYELRQEMMAKAGVPLLIATTRTFLRHAADHLDARVSPQTVDQAKELPDLLQRSESATRSMLEDQSSHADTPDVDGDKDKDRAIKYLLSLLTHDLPVNEARAQDLLKTYHRSQHEERPGEASAEDDGTSDV